MPVTPAKPPATVLRVARAAGGLHVRNRALTGLGWTLTGCLGVALVATGVLRLLTGDARWWVVPVGAVAVAVVVTLVWAVSRRWTAGRAAGEIDRANGTEGALRTALEITDDDGEPAFVAMARARGESVASVVDPRKGVAPARWDGWWWAAAVGAGCVLVGLFVPRLEARAPGGPDPLPQVGLAMDGVEGARNEMAAVDPGALPEPEAWSKAQAELDALDEELRNGEGRSDAPARTAAALDDAADELERQNDLAAAEERALRERADSFEPRDRTDASRLVERLTDALARNDMGEAQRAAGELDRLSEGMTDEQRRGLAETLEDLASTLDPDADGASPPQPWADAGYEPMDQLGPNEQPDTPPAQAVPPQDQAEGNAPPPGEHEEHPKDLPEALRNRAEELRKPPQERGQSNDQSRQQPQDERRGDQRNSSPQQQGQSGQDRKGQPGEQEQGRQGNDPSSQQQPDEAGRTEPGERSGNEPKPAEQPSDQSDNQPGNQSGERPGEQQGRPGNQPRPGEPGQQGQPSQQQGQQPGQQPGQEPRENLGQTRGEQQGGEGQQGQPQTQPGSRSDQQGADPQDRAREGAQPGATQQPEPGERPGGEPGAVERAVRDMQQRSQGREQNRRVAEALRERSRGLIDPERRDGPGGAGRDDTPLVRRDPIDNPAQFEPVDATGANDPGADEPARMVGEWYDPHRRELPAGERTEAAGELRRAARRARDAVENQQVPRRYRDLIQRVFDRVDKRADEVGGPAPQGEDAG